MAESERSLVRGTCRDLTVGRIVVTVVKIETTVRKAKSEPRSNARRVAETSIPRDPILDINGVPIDSEWQATFRGAFWGEGWLTVNSYASVTARVGMGLRSDDISVLREFQRRLGGSLHIDKSKAHLNPVARWSVDIAEDGERIWRILDRERTFPFRKRKELPYWKTVLDFKLAHRGRGGGRYGPLIRAEIDECIAQIKRLRIWHPE